MTAHCPEAIGSLAFELLMQRSNALEHDLPEGSNLSVLEGSVFSVEENVVRFSSLESRDQCAAHFIYKKNRSSFKNNPTQWIQLAYKMWHSEVGIEGKSSGTLLALVNHEQDVFSLAAQVIKDGGLGAYDVLHTVESFLPYLKTINIDGLIQLCIAQYEQTKNDMIASKFLNELEPMLVSQPTYCMALREKIVESPIEQTLGLYQRALFSLVRSTEDKGIEFLLEDAGNANELIKAASIWVLGITLARNNLKASNSKEVEEVILNNIASENARVRNSSISVAARCLLVSRAFDDPLATLAESDDQIALCAIAESLLANFKEAKDHPDLERWTALLSNISTENQGGINSLDLILYQLIESKIKVSLAIETLSDWIAKHGQNVRRDKSLTRLFDSTSHIIMKNTDLASQVITDWLLADEGQLASAATALLAEMQVRGIKSVKFNQARIDQLDSDELILLVRRVIGFIYDENHLFSLINSLLDVNSAKERTYGIVLELFINELGEDYPEFTIECLEASKKSESDKDRKRLYSTALKKIKMRTEALAALPYLTEFWPNPDLEREFIRARAKQMAELMEEARKGSIVEMIGKKIPLKAGRSWFSYRDGKYSEVSDLKQLSSQATIPRRTVTDEVGAEITSYLMRNASKGDK